MTNPVKFSKSCSIIKVSIRLICYLIILFFAGSARSQSSNENLEVIAFYTAKNDLDHISFVLR